MCVESIQPLPLGDVSTKDCEGGGQRPLERKTLTPARPLLFLLFAFDQFKSPWRATILRAPLSIPYVAACHFKTIKRWELSRFESVRFKLNSARGLS